MGPWGMDRPPKGPMGPKGPWPLRGAWDPVRGLPGTLARRPSGAPMAHLGPMVQHLQYMGSCSCNAQATEADVSGAHHDLLIHMHLDFCPSQRTCKKSSNARATSTSCQRRRQNHDRRGCKAHAPGCRRRRRTHWAPPSKTPRRHRRGGRA